MIWRRLESATVDPDLAEGLEARVADPLWLLARQWQAGEFRGEDAADPLLVRLESQSARIARVRLGGGSTLDVDSVAAPLEALVEAEPIRTGRSGARVSAELGQILIGQLRRSAAGRTLADGLRTEFPVSLPPDDGLDPRGRRRLELLSRASIDGVRLAAALAADDALAARLVAQAGATGDAAAALAALLAGWAADSASAFVEPLDGSAWDPRRLEYSFSLGAEGDETWLGAREYPGGDLSWFHFDVEASAGVPAGDAAVARTLTVLPVPLRYAGMPAGRFWELEEGDVFFGGIEAGPTDLPRVALAGFATSYGDDWYLVPLRLAAGTVTRIVTLEVVDDFERVTGVPAAAAHDGASRACRFFELTGDGGPEQGLAPLLAILPTLDTIEAARPLEDVRFVRDEPANLAWAVERRIETATGRPIDLAARSAAGAASEAADAGADDRWPFVLATSVPDNWVPLVPVRLGDDGAMVFQRGRLPSGGDGAAARGARGVILEPDRRFLLHEEEVPSEGLRVVRTFQETRAVAGRRFTWVGRRKGPGRGAGASGLAFDLLRPGEGPEAGASGPVRA